MSKMEIEKRIEQLEYNMFMLKMKDRWTREDFDADAKMWHEYMELKKMLK